jgi:low temperature requirement protein LtrA
LLLTEAALGFALAILLSMLASGMGNLLGDPATASAETPLRFAAGGAFLFAIFAMVASRGARRRRGWSWTLGALLQVALAIGTGIAVIGATWHPAYLAGFGLAAVVMTVLSTGNVRRALGQE